MEDVTPEADPQILTVPGFECPALYYTWLITGEDKYIVYHGNVDYTWEVTKKEWETEQTKLAGWLTAICALIGHRIPQKFEDPYFTGQSASGSYRGNRRSSSISGVGFQPSSARIWIP